jgi:hypothetical protein
MMIFNKAYCLYLILYCLPFLYVTIYLVPTTKIYFQRIMRMYLIKLRRRNTELNPKRESLSQIFC